MYEWTVVRGLIEKFQPKWVVLNNEDFNLLFDRAHAGAKHFDPDGRPYLIDCGVRLDLKEWKGRNGLLDLTGDSPVFTKAGQ